MSKSQTSVKIATSGQVVPVHCAHTDIISTDKMVPNPRNPNRHPKYQVDLLAKIIVAQGWRAPITVSRRSGFIVRGHCRFQAAAQAGFEKVPVDYQEYKDEAAEWADLVADNRVAELAELDMDFLKQGFEEMELEEFDAELFGFSEIELGQLLDTMDYTSANDANAEWDGMPEFRQDEQKPYRSIIVHIRNEDDVQEFFKLLGQKYDKNKYIWHPKQDIDHVADLRWVSEE